MMRALVFALLLAGCAAPEIPPDAEVQVTVRPSSSCAPRNIMVAGLANQFGEAPVASGMTRQGVVMEIFTAQDGATFSIVYSSLRTGVSCIAWHGGGWQFRALPEGEIS